MYDPAHRCPGRRHPRRVTIAFGSARYGRWAELHQLARGFFELTDLFRASRLPDVVGGVQRDEAHPHPGIYPMSHRPQAWSASAVVLMLQALLGMRAMAPLGLLLVDPHLPVWLPDVALHGLRLGSAEIDVAFRRRPRDGRTEIDVLRVSGRARVRRLAVGGAVSRLAPFAG